MITLCINVGKGTINNRGGQGKTLIFAKTVIYNDFHVRYGGSAIALCGVLYDTGIKYKGRIVPGFPGTGERIWQDPGTGYFLIVKNRLERKRKLIELAEYFISMSGGFTRAENVLEILTRACTGSRHRPIGFFTLSNYRNKVAEFLRNSCRGGFVRKDHLGLLVFFQHAPPGRQPASCSSRWRLTHSAFR